MAIYLSQFNEKKKAKWRCSIYPKPNPNPYPYPNPNPKPFFSFFVSFSILGPYAQNI